MHLARSYLLLLSATCKKMHVSYSHAHFSFFLAKHLQSSSTCARIKKWYFVELLFFCILVNAVNFFFLLSSLSFARILSLLFCSMLIHSISKKNERKRDSLARLPRATHTHTHIYTLVADREKKNDLILAHCTCVPAVYIFCTFRSDEKRTEGKSWLFYSIKHRRSLRPVGMILGRDGRWRLVCCSWRGDIPSFIFNKISDKEERKRGVRVKSMDGHWK